MPYARKPLALHMHFLVSEQRTGGTDDLHDEGVGENRLQVRPRKQPFRSADGAPLRQVQLHDCLPDLRTPQVFRV